MTAEIGLLNKSAVALATDSAVTIAFGQNKKIYQSANKLFMLSKLHPVGVMIYGNASFMNINWETIIKQYRNTLGIKEFNSLHDYSKHLLKYIESNREFFPKSQQEDYVKNFTINIYGYIRNEILTKFEKAGLADDSKLLSITDEIINNSHNHFKSLKIIKDINGKKITKDVITNYRTNYTKVLNSIIKLIFEKLPLTKSNRNKLINLGLQFLYKDIFHSHSGIVIAGYGKKDIFPKLNSYILEGISSNKLKFKDRESIDINFQMNAAVIPFAQSEMVYTFMEGVDPDYENLIEKSMRDLLDKYSYMFSDFLKKNTPLNVDEIQKQLINKNEEIFIEMQKNLETYREENYTNSITQIVSVLPKDELAAMAESLVNLTSFKRRVSSDDETVGGPIDVAVISKGDGFVWIKRKHYFDPKLNQHFFQNYYRGI